MRFVILLFAMIFASAAQSQERCIAALIRDKGSLDFRDATSLALTKLLEQSSSDKESWNASIAVPIYGVPVEASGGSAKEATKSYVEKTNLNWKSDRLVSVATQTLSRNSVEAYKTCINANRSGPLIIASDATSDSITITVRWIGSPGTQAEGEVIVDGGILLQKFPKTWLAHGSKSVIAKRKPHENLRVIANIGNDSTSEFVAYLPALPARNMVLLIGSCIGHGGLAGVRLWGPPTEFCNGISAWGRYDAQIQQITTLGSCIGRGGPEGVTLYGPPGQPCGGMPSNAWGTYGGGADVKRAGISSCTGHGNILEGHLLWGPTGAPCGGFSTWSVYDQGTKTPR